MVLPKESGQLLKHFPLLVETDLSVLHKIIPWFESNCATLFRSQTIFLHIQIILIEGFTNTVKYAHLNLSSHTPIEISINIFENLIEIKIWDYGLAFDLHQQLQEELNISSEDLIKKESHRGLLLMNSLTDELIYSRDVQKDEEKNCLVMRRYITRNTDLLI